MIESFGDTIDKVVEHDDPAKRLAAIFKATADTWHSSSWKPCVADEKYNHYIDKYFEDSDWTVRSWLAGFPLDRYMFHGGHKWTALEYKRCNSSLDICIYGSVGGLFIPNKKLRWFYTAVELAKFDTCYFMYLVKEDTYYRLYKFTYHDICKNANGWDSTHLKGTIAAPGKRTHPAAMTPKSKKEFGLSMIPNNSNKLGLYKLEN